MSYGPHSEHIGGEVLSQSDLVDDHGPSLNLDGVDEEWLLGALFRDLYRGEQAKAVLVEAEMRRVAELNQQLEHKFCEGLGQLQARIPLEMYLYWQAREGEGFWQEQSNLDYFGARNPGFLIKTKGRPTIIVDKPFSASPPDHKAVIGVKPAGGASNPPPAALPSRSKARRGRWGL